MHATCCRTCGTQTQVEQLVAQLVWQHVASVKALLGVRAYRGRRDAPCRAGSDMNEQGRAMCGPTR